jgi:Bacterial SH3 domain
MSATFIEGEGMDLKTGTYYAAGSMYARSYRVIANQGNRTCIKIVNGPANPYEGFQHITVSSVSSSGGELLVDATGETISINSAPNLVTPEGTFHFSTGARSGIYQHVKDDFDPDDAIDECLSSTGKYEKTMQGNFITGIDPKPNKGQLIAQTPDSQINVRTGPGTTFDSPHYGVVGDEVTLIESAKETGSEQIWYKVKFTGSGVEGWIRSDFIQR